MAFLALIAKPTPAATFSSRTKAPTVELSDLASFAAQARSNKWFSRSSNESGVADVFIKTRTILTAALFMATGLATADQTTPLQQSARISSPQTSQATNPQNESQP